MPSSIPSPADNTLHRTGRPAPRKGIYNVVHDPPRRANHSVVLRGGELFPKCPKREHTSFLPVTVAPYVFEDEDFTPAS